MYALKCPILPEYFKGGKCQITQPFGRNYVSFYKQLGLLGHNGIDFMTQFRWKYYLDLIKGEPTDKEERDGKIPVCAAHDGYLTTGQNSNRTKGIYMTIESEPTEIYGRECKVETMYFHLDRVRRWKGDGRTSGFEPEKGENFVKAGTIIGYSDNTGEYTTAPHLHFGMYIKWKKGDSYVKDYDNGYDGAVDPMPFMTYDTVTYEYKAENLIYFKGKLI